MTAEGRMTTTAICQSFDKGVPVRIMITDDPNGRAATGTGTTESTWYRATRKTGVVAATVTGYQPIKPQHGNVLYELHTDLGRVQPCPGAQTFPLATDQTVPTPAPAVEPPAPAVVHEEGSAVFPVVLTLRELANLVNRMGEDVHGGGFARLADGVERGHVQACDIPQILQETRTPAGIRVVVEKATARVAEQVTVPEMPSVQLDQLKKGDVIRFAGEQVRQVVEEVAVTGVRGHFGMKLVADGQTRTYSTSQHPTVYLCQRPGQDDGEPSPLRQRVLIAGIEHLAAGFGNQAWCGRQGAPRYVWEILSTGLLPEYEWIIRYMGEHPEVFDMPATSVVWGQRQIDLSNEADQRAKAAWDTGDYATALAELELAEEFHPAPGNWYAEAIAKVRAKMEESAAAVRSPFVSEWAETLPGDINVVVTSGPHKPTSSVKCCDVCDTSLSGRIWWLLSSTTRGWGSGNAGAGCAPCVGKPEPNSPAPVTRPTGPAAALEAMRERLAAKEAGQA